MPKRVVTTLAVVLAGIVPPLAEKGLTVFYTAQLDAAKAANLYRLDLKRSSTAGDWTCRITNASYFEKRLPTFYVLIDAAAAGTERQVPVRVPVAGPPDEHPSTEPGRGDGYEPRVRYPGLDARQTAGLVLHPVIDVEPNAEPTCHVVSTDPTIHFRDANDYRAHGHVPPGLDFVSTYPNAGWALGCALVVFGAVATAVTAKDSHDTPERAARTGPPARAVPEASARE